MIHIITPCTRPDNLQVIQKSIPIECTWHVVLDSSVQGFDRNAGLRAVVYQSPYTGHAGNPNRNYALDSIVFEDLDWIYVLDDDNIIHPRWYESVSRIYQNELNMISWGQIWKNGSVRLAPTESPRVGTTDTSCYMVRGRVMRTLRYELDYVADGILAEKVAAMGNHLCITDYLGYYNWLRTPEDRL